MIDSNLQAQTDAARAYEQIMVPALFEEWVEPVLDAAGICLGQRVLDVGCGTGVLARAASAQVGPTGSVTGVDPNPGMLAVARQLGPTVNWRQGAAEAISFPDRSFDAVVSQFGLMFFKDRLAAIGEMLRVLAPGGVLAVAVWDSLENSPAYAIEVALLERIAGQAAADALRAPFVLGDRRELAALFEDAGVSSANIATRTGTATFPSVRVMVGADLRGWLPVMGVVLSEQQIDRILSEAERELAPFVRRTGEVAFDSPAHIVVGTKPGRP